MDPRLIPLLEYKYLDDKIIVRDESKSSKSLSTAEFNKKFVIKRLPGIFYDGKVQPLVMELCKKLRTCNERYINGDKVKKFLKEPKNYFRVEHINKTMGYGIVANEDIPEGVVVGIYGGELVFKDKSNTTNTFSESTYDMSLYSDYLLNGKKYHISVRAKDGDLTRFTPHAWTEVELKNINLDEKINRNDVITSNVDFKTIIIDGKPFHYFITTKAIKKYDPVVTSYGEGYWNVRNIHPSVLVRVVGGFAVANFDAKEKKYIVSKEVVLQPESIAPQAELKIRQDEVVQQKQPEAPQQEIQSFHQQQLHLQHELQKLQAQRLALHRSIQQSQPAVQGAEQPKLPPPVQPAAKSPSVRTEHVSSPPPRKVRYTENSHNFFVKSLREYEPKRGKQGQSNNCMRTCWR